MAEFVEIMRQARRMCNDQMDCEDCPLCYENNGANCRFALDEKYQADAELDMKESLRELMGADFRQEFTWEG